MGLYAGITSGAIPDYTGNKPNTSCNLNMNCCNNASRESIVMCQPAGFQCIPKDNLTCVYGGNNYQDDSVVLGYLNSCADVPNSIDLEGGETQTFNYFNYSLRLEKDKINAKWKEIETKIAIGDNVVMLMVEIYQQMLSYINAMNIYWVNMFDKHTHKYLPGPGGPTETAPTSSPYVVVDYVPRAPFTTLKEQLDRDAGSGIKGATCFIDINGEKYHND